MNKLLFIFVILILADSFVLAKQNEDIHSEYVSAELLHSEINAEFIMPARINYTLNQPINGLIYFGDVSPHISPKGHKFRKAKFKCYCGNEFETIISKVLSKHTQSCGCYQKQRISEVATKHGYSNYKVYRVWIYIKARCYRTQIKYYKNYGGRGISVCEEWLGSPKTFIEWALKNGYKEGLTIDRRNNDGNYEPSNCRFVTTRENTLNQRLLRNTNKSGYRGVSFIKRRNKWTVGITVRGKYTFLGEHKIKTNAVSARNNYIIKNNLQNDYKLQEVLG